MKILITEDKRIRLIQNYIMDTFPVVHSVDIIPKKTLLGSGPNKYGKDGLIDVNVILVNFKSGEMQYSPTYTLNKISKQVNSIFGLGWKEYGSHWDFQYKMVR